MPSLPLSILNRTPLKEESGDEKGKGKKIKNKLLWVGNAIYVP